MNRAVLHRTVFQVYRFCHYIQISNLNILDHRAYCFVLTAGWTIRFLIHIPEQFIISRTIFSIQKLNNIEV